MDILPANSEGRFTDESSTNGIQNNLQSQLWSSIVYTDFFRFSLNYIFVSSFFIKQFVSRCCTWPKIIFYWTSLTLSLLFMVYFYRTIKSLDSNWVNFFLFSFFFLNLIYVDRVEFHQ
jgi:hypothetical protein